MQQSRQFYLSDWVDHHDVQLNKCNNDETNATHNTYHTYTKNSTDSELTDDDRDSDFNVAEYTNNDESSDYTDTNSTANHSQQISDSIISDEELIDIFEGSCKVKEKELTEECNFIEVVQIKVKKL